MNYLIPKNKYSLILWNSSLTGHSVCFILLLTWLPLVGDVWYCVILCYIPRWVFFLPHIQDKVMVLKGHSGKNLIVLTGEVWRTSSRRLDIQRNLFAVCHIDKASLHKMLLHPNSWALWFFCNPLHIPFTCLRFPEMLLLIWILPFLQGYTCLFVHIIITYVKAFLRIKVNHINYYTRNIGINYNSSIQVRARGHSIFFFFFCGHSILWKLPQLLPLLALSIYHHQEQAFGIHCFVFLYYLFMWILPHFPFQNEWKLWNQRLFYILCN